LLDFWLKRRFVAALSEANFMSNTTTISVRVPEDTRKWLERHTHKMGSAGSVAARILEESRRRESFPAVEFRDSADGRLAYVSETRVPVHLLVRAVNEFQGDLAQVSAHFHWPRWKVDSAYAYASAYQDEIEADAKLFERRSDFEALRRQIPNLVLSEVVGA
jgi:hypothetical protein